MITLGDLGAIADELALSGDVEPEAALVVPGVAAIAAMDVDIVVEVEMVRVPVDIRVVVLLDTVELDVPVVLDTVVVAVVVDAEVVLVEAVVVGVRVVHPLKVKVFPLYTVLINATLSAPSRTEFVPTHRSPPSSPLTNITLQFDLPELALR